MEKYGVDTDEEKTASVGEKCPQCGKPVEREGNVRRCPDHGTRPFEARVSDDTEDECETS